MKKIILIFMFLFIMVLPASAYTDDIYKAADNVDLSGVNEMLGNFSFKDLTDDILNGDGIQSYNIGEKIIGYLFHEVKAAVKTLAIAVVLAVLCKIVGGLCLNGDAEEVTFFICYALITGIAVSGVGEIINTCKNAVSGMCVFVTAIVPCIAGLGLASGKALMSFGGAGQVASAAALNGFIIKDFVVPCMYTSLAVSLAGNFNKKISLDKLSDLIRKTALWVVCGIQTFFCAIVGISGILSNGIDGVGGKIAKFTVSSAVPVVGKILSDAVGALASGASVIKGVAGGAGMLLIILIIAVPILKTFAVLVAYKICAAITQPITDKRITSALCDISDVLSSLCGILFAMGASSVISLAILLGGLK